MVQALEALSGVHQSSRKYLVDAEMRFRIRQGRRSCSAARAANFSSGATRGFVLADEALVATDHPQAAQPVVDVSELIGDVQRALQGGQDLGDETASEHHAASERHLKLHLRRASDELRVGQPRERPRHARAAFFCEREMVPQQRSRNGQTDREVTVRRIAVSQASAWRRSSTTAPYVAPIRLPDGVPTRSLGSIEHRGDVLGVGACARLAPHRCPCRRPRAYARVVSSRRQVTPSPVGSMASKDFAARLASKSSTLDDVSPPTGRRAVEAEKRPRTHRCGAQERSLCLVEQAVAPVERGRERAVPFPDPRRPRAREGEIGRRAGARDR